MYHQIADTNRRLKNAVAETAIIRNRILHSADWNKLEDLNEQLKEALRLLNHVRHQLEDKYGGEET